MLWINLLVWMVIAASAWLLWPMWYGIFCPRRLNDVTSLTQAAETPLISIIVPARNEAASVEPALRSLLALDFPRFEVIAIDDRSTDGTGAIMDKLAAGDDRCRVVHVTELAAGWLGKNHANAIGVDQSRGEFILFTDADVIFAPDVLSLAIAHMQRDNLDHLAVVPDTMPGTFGEQMLMNYFVLQFATFTRMWLTRFAWARGAFIGIGAFNMIRRRAYDATGGHTRLCMEVADDMMLGKLVKNAGLKQDVLLGEALVRVKWQTGVGGMVRGLDKNAFAGARYSVGLVALSVGVHMGMAFLPLLLLLTGLAALPASILLMMIAGSHILLAVHNRFNVLAALMYPVAAVIFAYIMIRSTYKTLRAGGVRWRDTFHPLADLRAGMIEWRLFGGLLRARR